MVPEISRTAADGLRADSSPASRSINASCTAACISSNGANEDASARGRVKKTCAILSQRLRADRKFAGRGHDEGELGTGAICVNAPGQRLD